MKLKHFIRKLESIKEELQNKEVCICSPNGLVVGAEIKFMLKDRTLFDKTKENIDYILISP